MKRNPQWKILALFTVLSLVALLAGNVLAHERREVGEYSFLVGWMVEPAYEAEKNGVDFRVNVGDATGEPVEGLADTVQVEVTFAENGTSQVMDLRGLFGQPGRYTVDIIPTRPGAYVLRFFGTTDGFEFDEIFEPYSMGGGFNDVASSSDIHFPETLPTLREMEGVTRGAQAAAEQAQAQAQAAEDSVFNASTFGVLAMALGALATVLAAASLGLVLRKR